MSCFFKKDFFYVKRFMSWKAIMSKLVKRNFGFPPINYVKFDERNCFAKVFGLH